MSHVATVFFRVIRFFAKTGFCPRLGTQPLQTITQPHCCRLLEPTPWLLCWLGGFEGPFQTPRTGLAKNRKTRENTVILALIKAAFSAMLAPGAVEEFEGLGSSHYSRIPLRLGLGFGLSYLA